MEAGKLVQALHWKKPAIGEMVEYLITTFSINPINRESQMNAQQGRSIDQNLEFFDYYISPQNSYNPIPIRV